MLRVWSPGVRNRKRRLKLNSGEGEEGPDGAVPYLAVGATDTPGHWPILSVGRPTALCRWRGNGGSGAVRSGKGGLVSWDTIRL